MQGEILILPEEKGQCIANQSMQGPKLHLRFKILDKKGRGIFRLLLLLDEIE